LALRGNEVLAAGYFSSEVATVPVSGGTARAIPLPSASVDTPARRGEALFHDASVSYQRWTSCATCHPQDGRVDGLNWDLLNDGVGNPKNVRSLLLAHERRPLMSLGVRADLPTAVRAGFRFIHFAEPTEDQVTEVAAYIASLRPEPSPFRTREGRLTPAGERGAALFAGKARCSDCHSGPHGSDGEGHDMGTGSPLDQGKRVRTPMLVELWRTAPYLHDGSAPSLRAVLTTRNRSHRFGAAHLLSGTELDDLVEYLRER
jgi:cytochrome c peroxidase